MRQNAGEHRCDDCRRYAGILKVTPDNWYILGCLAQLERELIRERVIAGLKNARAKGKVIGRIRKRNDVLIHSLLDAGMSFRMIAKLAVCSHGSVSASKKEWLAKKEKLLQVMPLMLGPSQIDLQTPLGS
jgi:hypothetical protein